MSCLLGYIGLETNETTLNLSMSVALHQSLSKISNVLQKISLLLWTGLLLGCELESTHMLSLIVSPEAIDLVAVSAVSRVDCRDGNQLH